MSGDKQNIPRAIGLSRAVMLNIKQNLAWAFGYNILLIPVATGLLKPLTGLGLSPIVAGLAMSLSSFFSYAARMIKGQAVPLRVSLFVIAMHLR